MENIIYNELRVRGYLVDVGVVEKRKMSNGKQESFRYEVDFIATNGMKKFYIQSAYRMDDPEKAETESRSLCNIEDSFSKIIIHGDDIATYIDEKGITPWAIGSDWVSKFSDPSQAISNEHYKLLKEYQERNTKYDNSSLFAVYKFFDWNVMFFICLIFVLLLWTTMSDEHRPTPTINFLRTKPIRFQSIYRTKWGYNLLVAYSLLLISGGVLFVVATIIGGIGEAQYPILIYAPERIEESFFYSHGDDAYFYFENLLTLIVKSGILVFAQIFFLNSMFSLIGKFMRNHYAVIVVTCIIAIAGYTFGHQYIAMDSSMYNPFIYFDTWNIVDGWKSIEASNGSVNFRNGMIILFISGSLLFCLGLLSKRKVTT